MLQHLFPCSWKAVVCCMNQKGVPFLYASKSLAYFGAEKGFFLSTLRLSKKYTMVIKKECMRVKNKIIWLVRYNYKTNEPVVCLSGFGIKLLRRPAFAPDRPKSNMWYLFYLKCRYTFSSPKSKFLGTSSAVDNVYLKALYKASPFTKPISRSDWSQLFISLIVEYEIANNAIQTHWIPAVFPK